MNHKQYTLELDFHFQLLEQLKMVGIFDTLSPKMLVFIFNKINDTVKEGLTVFWELFTMIPCASKNLIH